MTSGYYRGAQAVIIAYDITNRNSFDIIKSKFLDKVKTLSTPNVSIAIVGNKSDLQADRKVEF